MKTCPFCNSPMEDGAKFCTNCGQKVENDVAAIKNVTTEPTVAPTPTPDASPSPLTVSDSTPGMTYENEPVTQQAHVQNDTYTNPVYPTSGMNQTNAQPNKTTQMSAQPAQNQYAGGFQQQVNGYGQQTGANGYGQQYGANSYGQGAGRPGGGYNPAMGGMQHPGMTKPKKNLLPFFIIGGVALVAIITVIVLLVTGVFGGKKGDPNDPNLGEYKAVALEMFGMTLDPSDYSKDEMTITLKSGGKAVILTGSDKSNATWTLEGEKFTLKGGGLDETGTLQDGVMKLPDLGGLGADWTFTKDGKPISGMQITSVGDDGILDGDGMVNDNSGVTLPGEGGSTGASTTPTPEGGNFVSPTTAIKYPRDWYGWARFYDFEGELTTEYSGEEFEDIFALFEKTDGGRAFFEIYETPDFSSKGDTPLLSLYVKENPNVLEPDGTDDAFLIDMELDDWDLFDIQTSMYGGKLNFEMEYDGGAGSCKVEFFLREWDAPWDESQDKLPPSYDIYCK